MPVLKTLVEIETKTHFRNLAKTRELAAIGRNINQIAKALNEAFHETERVRLDTLAALSQSTAIRSLVRASQQAWEAENGVD